MWFTFAIFSVPSGMNITALAQALEQEKYFFDLWIVSKYAFDCLFQHGIFVIYDFVK